MRDKMIPGRIDNEGYKQITLQSDYDREGKLIVAYDDQGDIYIQTEGFVRFANTSGSRVGKEIMEMLRDLVSHEISDIKIGTEIQHKGNTYICKAAPKGCDDCTGCAFECEWGKPGSPCGKYLCASDERHDGTDIQFVRKEVGNG